MERNFGKLLEEIEKVASELDQTWGEHQENACGYQVSISKLRGSTRSYLAEIVIPVFVSKFLEDVSLRRELDTGTDYVEKMYVGSDQYVIKGVAKDKDKENALRNAFKTLLGKLEMLKRNV